MAEIIEMPLMSDTMEEGLIVDWHKKVGDTIKAGDVLAEVETDKATMELESYFDGTVLHIAADKGSAVKVGGLIAIIGKAGEDVSAIVQKYAEKNGAATPAAQSAPAPAQPVAAAPQPVAAAPQPAPTPAAPSPAGAPASGDDGRLKASPLAKALAKDKGVDLAAIAGSGEGGRIVKRDVEAFTPSAAPAAQAGPVHVYTPQAGELYHDEGLSQMRKAIARRMGESKYSAPHFYLTMAIDMRKAAQARQLFNEDSDVKISFNDLVVKACAAALRKHPRVNASWLGDKVRYHHYINVGVAVALEDGLIVPVIRNADAKGLTEIAGETRKLAERARNRELQPEEFQGNTFTVSNLGMFGIEQFTAIINSPDACILAVGAIQDEPVVEVVDGVKQVGIGSIMRVTLSCDHRVVDGAVGSAFLQTLKSMLENPMRMLL